MAVHRTAPLIVSLVAMMAALGCDDSSSPSSPAGPSPVASGAAPVRGAERLAWSQGGDVSRLRFRVYVDDRPVDLVAVTCDGSTPQAACTSPLPPLTDGVHTIALVNIDTSSGSESTRTDVITLQKLSGRAATFAASFPDATPRFSSLRVDAEVTIADGLSFAVDVVARGVHAPAQLAWIPDGRLLVAEANGLVRMVRPGEPNREEPALDAHALLEPSPIGPLGLACHPDFPRNRFVYVSFLARERRDRTLLRIVRLREVGDTLGEPTPLFEAPVTMAAATLDEQLDGSVRPRGGPQMAFGPDGLLYVALPLGVEFDNEPAASTAQASMLRLSDDGRVPAIGPLSGVDAHPLGFTWHPSTAALWAIFPGRDGQTLLRTIVTGHTAALAGAEEAGLRITESGGRSPGALVIQRGATRSLLLAQALLAAAPENGATRTVRLSVPIVVGNELNGLLDRIGDAVAGSGGTLFLATNNTGRTADSGALGEEVILRLTPRAR